MTKQVDYQEQVDKYAKKLADSMKEVFRAQREFDRAQKLLSTAQGELKNIEFDYKYWVGKLFEQEEI